MIQHRLGDKLDALRSCVLNAEIKTGDKDEILERIDELVDCLNFARVAVKTSDSVAEPFKTILDEFIAGPIPHKFEAGIGFMGAVNECIRCRKTEQEHK